jgi:N-acetyl-D-muramate 6-phosphate phosphatase
MLEAVLFDLDGTLADTAPDLGGTINTLLLEEGRPEQSLAFLRPYTSQGVRGMLHAAFGIDDTHADYARLTARFLDIYAGRLCDRTTLFAGIPELLDTIESMRMEWGIVTNKRMRFTDPLVELLRLDRRTRCIVSGDTTAEAKPSPLPILHACSLLGCRPENAIYVGDDRRDVVAGRAAGCITVAVTYGYLGDCGPIEDWGADLIVDHPTELIDYLANFAGRK